MVSKHIYLSLLVRVVLLTLNIFLISHLCYTHQTVILIAFTSIIAIIQISLMIRYLNSINRKIAFFFDAIQNNDSTLHYPEKITHKPMRELNQSLNKVNLLIQKAKMENIEQEQYYKALLEHTSTGIITYNNKDFVLLANSAAKRLLNYDHLTHLIQLKRVDIDLYNQIKKLRPNQNKLIELENENGSIQLALKCTSFTLKKEELYLVSIHDIRNELDQKEVDTWIRLIRVLTHEIMNSIAPITSLSDTLMRFHQPTDSPFDSDMVKENTLKGLSVIKERGEGLMNFVDSYRQLTRLPKPEIKPIKMVDFLEQLKLLANNYYPERKVEITIKIAPSDMVIHADEKLISQVVINIIKNAIQAVQNTENPLIAIEATITSDSKSQITISDNGPGIPHDLQNEIFVPFFTTKESGSGIGLSLSKQIMRLHGGQIKLSSVQNQRTTFTLIW